MRWPRPVAREGSSQPVRCESCGSSSWPAASSALWWCTSASSLPLSRRVARGNPQPPPAMLDPLRVPSHVAIIMDGNGRWATSRGLPRAAGHRAGLGAIRRAIEGCRDLGIRTLTLYAFSTENWRRPSDEVGMLLGLLHERLVAEAEELQRIGIRVRVIGDLDVMASETRAQIERVEALTAEGKALLLNIAFNYGGRAEIARAARALASRAMKRQLDVEQITEPALADCLYTAGQPDPELLIRTGGEQRLSNFLLWQAAYAELIFLDVFWPDFDRHHLAAAVNEYQKRQRRFGGATGA